MNLSTFKTQIKTTWPTLPTRYKQYVFFFAITSPLVIVALIWPWFEIPYALIFFLASFALIFIQEPVPEFPQNSTLQHYERSSRFNWYNYLPIVLLILASLCFVWLPVNKAIVSLVFWGIAVALIFKFSTPAREKLGEELVADYLKSQFPQLGTLEIYQFIDLAQTDAKVDAIKTAKLLDIDQETAQQVVNLYFKYVRNNLGTE